MKKLKTTIAILLTFTMILTGGASLSLLAVSAETNSSSAEEQVNESAGGSDEQKDQKDQEKNSSDKEKSDKAEKKSKGSSSDASDSKDTIKKRDIEAKLVKEDLFEDKEEKKKTDTYKSLISFWGSLWDRDPSVSKKDTDLKVTVSGKMPEGIKAEAEFINSGNTTAFSEQGMLKFRLTLFDKDGNVYVPDEAVKVSVEGKSLKEELKDENAPIVYTYESVPERAKQLKEKYDKEFYTADVKVYKSKKADKKLLRYEVYDKDKEYKNGKDAVRYFNDKDGLKTDEDTVTFEYDFNSSYGEGSARYKAGEKGKDAGKDSAVFILSSQMKERTLTASAGDAKITVTGHLDKDVTLKATEITKKDKAYAGYVEETAKQLDKEKSELYMARAFDIKLIDSTTGKEFEPDSDVKVDIDLGDKKIDDDTDLDVVHFRDKSDKKPEVIDASADGSTVKFKTDGFSVYVVAQTEKETVLTARDGKKYKITVSYGRAAEIPDDAELSARELTDDEYEEYYKKAGDALDVNKFSYARIFDISIVGKDGKEYQPKDDVSVTIELMDDEDNEELKVVHFGDKTEVLDAKTEGDEVSFKTDSFSIFAVVRDDGEMYDEDGNRVFIRTYRFYTYTSEGDPIEYQVATDQGTTTSTQKIKNGEKPVAPIIPQDPMEQEAVFVGWFEGVGEGDDVELADEPYDFNNIPEITENDEVHLYAKFSNNVNVLFHEQYDSTSESFPLAATRKVEVTHHEGHDEAYGTLDLSEITTKYYDSNNNAMPGMEFCGWSATPVSVPGSETDDEGKPVIPVTGSVQVTSEDNNEFYPLFRPVKWLSFYSAVAGSGATYYSPKSIAEGEEYSSLSELLPTYAKHIFKGWYTGTLSTEGGSESVIYNEKTANEDGSLIEGARDDAHGVKVEDGKLKLTDNATLYAKWEDDPDGVKPKEKNWYLVKIDPNGGALYTYDAEENLTGTGSTWFWSTDYGEGGEPIEEYSNVTRDYVESQFGNYYYVNQNRDYYKYPDEYVSGENPNRKTYYTTKINEATSLNTYRYSPGAYRYAGWYEVNKETGQETPYVFGQTVDHDTTLKLHWKKAGEYYIVYDPVMDREGDKVEGTMEDGSESAEDENGYADSASIELTRSAQAPDGYEFVGWSIRGDDSGKVYRTDEVISLPAEFSVSMNGKNKIFFEAVYSKASSSKITFNANKGVLKDNIPSDFEYVSTEAATKPVFSVGTDKKTVDVTNMINNGEYKLAEEEFFERDGCIFTGWNTKADGSGKHYDAGKTYGFDAEEPTTLYAEWKVKVYFDKNDADAVWNESAWGTQNDDGYVDSDGRQYYDNGDGRYYTLANVDACMKEPQIKPSKQGSSFKFWSSTEGAGAEAFSFSNTKITEEMTLYAGWSSDALVPLHVFTYDPSDDDADAVDRDSWRKTSKVELEAGSPVTTEDITSEYLDIPDEYSGYEYVYAYVGTATDKNQPKNNNTVESLEAGAGGNVTATYHNSETASLNDGQALYLVYAPKVTKKTVKISYVKETGGGEIENVVGAAAGKITYDSGELRLNDSFVEDGIHGILNSDVVSQDQTINATTKDLVVDQSSTKKFNMPARLDDGSKPLELIYGKIGTGNYGAENLSSLDTDTGKKLHVQIRDGVLKWSYDGDTWKEFKGGESGIPTIYAVYRERGHQLEITKSVTKETEVRDYKHFKVTITSDAITQDSYDVEGTGYNKVKATPAKRGTPGKIELDTLHGSDIIISGLATGEYTVAETRNENYVLTAKTGDIDSGEMTDTNVTDNTTLDPITLDKDMKAELYNEPQFICRIDTNGRGSYEYFYTLNSALDYTNDPALDGKATIEMLVDYVMPAQDALLIPDGYDIEIKTAQGSEYTGEGPYAVISRENGFTKNPMFENEGALTFTSIVLDGKNTEVSSEMVRSNAEEIEDSGEEGAEVKSGLYIGINASFINANNTGNGGAVHVSKGKAYISGGSFENNKADKGGAVYVSAGGLEIAGCTIKGNHANEGGAIYYAGGGTVKIEGGSISYNAADSGNGGGIYAANGTFEIKGGSIMNNTASDGNGGAVFAESAVINVSGKQTKINNNTAKSGGAVYFDEFGTFTIASGEIKNNTATEGEGGAVRLPEGSAEFKGGTMSGNSAENANGGAFYGGNVNITITNGTYSGNTAVNGSAIFISNGSAAFTGGNINDNISTQGGAVGVGSDSARLKFSGSIKVWDNYIGSENSEKKSNVYLDQNSDSIISSDTFSNGAEVGIYVPGAYTDQLFKDRGQASAIFATYTNTYNDKTIIPAFKNDRLSSLSAVALAGRTIMWGKTIDVEVRYVPSYSNDSNEFPPNVTGSSKTITNYYLPDSENSVSSIAEDLRANYNITFLTNTSVFGGAFSQGDTAFNQFLTDVNWDSGSETETENWKYVRRYKDAQGHFVTGNVTKLIIYFSEPSYISVENNTDNELDISQLEVFNRSAINGTALDDAGYGYVYAVNGAIRNELLPITADDLKLGSMKSVKLVFPGATGKGYNMTGEYKDVATGTEIPVRINGTSYGDVPSDKYDSFTLGTTEDKDIANTPVLPTKAGGSIDIVFGGDKPICKIEATGITPTAADKIAARSAPDASGKVEYCFSTLTNAKDFATNHQLKTTSIQMLVDYLIPKTDVLVIPQGYDITLTTATNESAEYHYDGSRSTISRDSDNDSSFITSTGGAATTFRIDNLKFDGKSLGGNINGGVVMTSNCIVDINNAEFVNCIANNGGGIYIQKGSRGDVNLSVRNTKFINCHSKSTANRQGGGAIWTDVQRNTYDNELEAEKNGFYMYNCHFTNCSAYDQGGAVFHRIDSNVDSITTVDLCTFTGCEAQSAGGMESGAKYVNISNCTMRNCSATNRNGGGLNFYSLNSASPTAECTVRVTKCTFDHCKVTGQKENNGGGLRSTAQNTYVTDCTFTYCSGKLGGGIASTNTNGIITKIHGCVIDNCTASQNGGGVLCTSKTLTIDDDIGNGNKKGTEIKNCVATKYGGGIRHERNAGETVLNIKNTTVYKNASNSTGDNGNGGGISIKDIRSVTITGSLIQENTAKSSGGGIYMGSNNTDRRITIDDTKIKGNSCANQGGGLYCNSHFTLRNGSMITGNTTTAAAENAAGVYLIDNRKLTVGDPDPDAKKPDSSSIKGNTAAGGVPSNMRLWSGKVNNVMVNNVSSVYVECDLSGRIGVVNASAKGTQFGSSRKKDPKGFGYADGTQVFRADDETLFGVIDRGDPNGQKIIWRGDVICKITDEAGHLLYLGEDDPAVFDALDVGIENDVSKKSAFSYLRNASPVLYYKDGTPYTGNNYCVKMLESYKATKQIITTRKALVDGGIKRNITLTTAGRTDADYPYRGRSGVPATITRDSNNNAKDMIYAGGIFTLQNITIDGAKTSTSNTRIIRTYKANTYTTITIGNKATLQNARVSGDGEAGWGGAVFSSWPDNAIILDGGEIKNCNATSGGGIYKEGSSSLTIISGNITSCNATSNGGGVYFGYTNKNAERNILKMEGGSITKCSAEKGGGLFMADQCTLRMSGGNIKSNTATSEGGGIAIGGNTNNKTKLNFSGRVVISGNRLDGAACNVQLAYASTKIINTSGLDRRASIGIYVPEPLYADYGVAGKPFGTYTNPSNLQRFVNDRNECKGGIMPGAADYDITVYWVEGSRKVILRKKGDNYESLEGAKFTVYHSDLENVVSDADGNRLENLESNGSGAFFSGELYYGTYYVKETKAPTNPGGYSRPADDRYFIITVSSSGVGYHDGSGYDKEIRAKKVN